MDDNTPLVQPEQIEQAILLIRGHRVMLDRDLATLYGVETKNLNRAGRRNLDRFPADFMFQLADDEAADLISNLEDQDGTAEAGSIPMFSPKKASPCFRACCAVRAVVV